MVRYAWVRRPPPGTDDASTAEAVCRGCDESAKRALQCDWAVTAIGPVTVHAVDQDGPGLLEHAAVRMLGCGAASGRELGVESCGDALSKSARRQAVGGICRVCSTTDVSLRREGATEPRSSRKSGCLLFNVNADKAGRQSHLMGGNILRSARSRARARAVVEMDLPLSPPPQVSTSQPCGV